MPWTRWKPSGILLWVSTCSLKKVITNPQPPWIFIARAVLWEIQRMMNDNSNINQGWAPQWHEITTNCSWMECSETQALSLIGGKVLSKSLDPSLDHHPVQTTATQVFITQLGISIWNKLAKTILRRKSVTNGKKSTETWQEQMNSTQALSQGKSSQMRANL